MRGSVSRGRRERCERGRARGVEARRRARDVDPPRAHARDRRRRRPRARRPPLPRLGRDRARRRAGRRPAVPGALPRPGASGGARLGDRRGRGRARAVRGDASAQELVQRARAGDPEARARLARIGGVPGGRHRLAREPLRPRARRRGRRLRRGGRRARPRAGAGGRTEGGAATCRRDAQVVPAELGSEAGLVGAALVGFEALDGNR